jgi:hypothetical protein
LLRLIVLFTDQVVQSASHDALKWLDITEVKGESEELERYGYFIS